MSGQRQKNRPGQEVLAFPMEGRSDAPKSIEKGTETLVAKRKSESLAGTERLMEEVCELENSKQALQRVKANKGSPGVDGMTVKELPEYLKQHGLEIGEQLRNGTYQPQPVRRVEIQKPDGSGVRKLGIPCVLDRFVQQAVLQVLQKHWDPTFSEHSHGFRPGHSARQAVREAQQYIAEGHGWVADLDLEKFFDRVNHDHLLAAVAERVADKRMLKLIRAFLEAGVMEDGLVSPVDEGTPQGGPLSPLLSNLVLDELDRELERRGHHFVRYADDCNIYVGSERAGQRVMESITHFIRHRLKLTVNQAKSAVARPGQRKFLGFSFTSERKPRRRIAPKAIVRFKERIREQTYRTRGRSLTPMVKEIATYLRGWLGYFGDCQTPSVLQSLESWLRRRLRSVVWKQWKRGRKRFRELRKRGVGKDLAAQTAGSPHGPWRIANSPALSIALSIAYFAELGLPPMVVRSSLNPPNRRTRTRIYGGVAGEEG
jgi:RNA-directed DNA polymerase